MNLASSEGGECSSAVGRLASMLDRTLWQLPLHGNFKKKSLVYFFLAKST
ncbi:hypothetical protein QUB60_27365 [Microcoleus sp. A2-C5]|nr:hypothetical protein [Lyngbya sp. CCAP 1446/10]MCW6049376.1 hypothetical protein [Lyngbya sp. CCAP 1446/10]